MTFRACGSVEGASTVEVSAMVMVEGFKETVVLQDIRVLVVERSGRAEVQYVHTSIRYCTTILWGS